jgi:hypothetical protein
MPSLVRAACLCLLALSVSFAADNKAPAQKFTAILIWGTDDAKPEGKDLKDLDATIQEKFAKLPVKWKNYYEVTRKEVTIKAGEPKHFKMSDKCEVKIHQTEKGMAVELIGDGKSVYKGNRSMPTKDILIIGGDDKNATAWFVVLKPE